MVDITRTRRIVALATSKIDALIEEARKTHPIFDADRQFLLAKMMAYSEAKSVVLDAALKVLVEDQPVLPLGEECCDKPPQDEAQDQNNAVHYDGISKRQAEKRRAKRISGNDIINYLWWHNGSARFEHILRDLYENHGAGKRLGLQRALTRLESLGTVHLDREDGKIIVVTAHLKSKEA